MAPAGDFDTFSTIFDFYLQTVPFNSARTQHYFGHKGIFYTETKTLFGAFAINDYGQNASTRNPPSTLPVYLESNGCAKNLFCFVFSLFYKTSMTFFFCFSLILPSA
jgi:hypothetical protein